MIFTQDSQLRFSPSASWRLCARSAFKALHGASFFFSRHRAFRRQRFGVVQRPFILLLTALLLAGSVAEAKVAVVGEPPPPFALKDEHGRVHRLHDLLGKPIILYFTQNMCHYCTQVIGFLKRANAAYADQGLTILTLNVWADSPKYIRRYREQFGLPFTMLRGKDRQLLKDYEVNYVPIIVFIGRDGRIRRIFDHYILPADFKASVREIVEGK